MHSRRPKSRPFECKRRGRRMRRRRSRRKGQGGRSWGLEESRRAMANYHWSQGSQPRKKKRRLGPLLLYSQASLLSLSFSTTYPEYLYIFPNQDGFFYILSNVWNSFLCQFVCLFICLKTSLSLFFVLSFFYFYFQRHCLLKLLERDPSKRMSINEFLDIMRRDSGLRYVIDKYQEQSAIGHILLARLFHRM